MTVSHFSLYNHPTHLPHQLASSFTIDSPASEFTEKDKPPERNCLLFPPQNHGIYQITFIYTPHSQRLLCIMDSVLVLSKTSSSPPCFEFYHLSLLKVSSSFHPTPSCDFSLFTTSFSSAYRPVVLSLLLKDFPYTLFLVRTTFLKSYSEHLHLTFPPKPFHPRFHLHHSSDPVVVTAPRFPVLPNHWSFLCPFLNYSQHSGLLIASFWKCLLLLASGHHTLLVSFLLQILPSPVPLLSPSSVFDSEG